MARIYAKLYKWASWPPFTVHRQLLCISACVLHEFCFKPNLELQHLLYSDILHCSRYSRKSNTIADRHERLEFDLITSDGSDTSKNVSIIFQGTRSITDYLIFSYIFSVLYQCCIRCMQYSFIISGIFHIENNLKFLFILLPALLLLYSTSFFLLTEYERFFASIRFICFKQRQSKILLKHEKLMVNIFI